MPEVASVIVLSLLAGASMPTGAVLAKLDLKNPAWLGDEWRHFIVAFGGGALVSAIALVLVPEGAKKVSIFQAAMAFSAGGVCFCLQDIYLNKLKSSAGQLVAMLSDFIPEAIALGTAFAAGQNTGILLAALIILQNLPEGFNAFEELSRTSNMSPNQIIGAFGLLALIGPAAGLAGYYLLSDSDMIMGNLMLFASGGILYLIFEDVAPQAKLSNRWVPALGAVAGFLLGLVGNMFVQAGHTS